MPPHLHLTHHHCGHHPTTVLKMPTSCTHVTVIHHCWTWTHCIMLQTHHRHVKTSKQRMGECRWAGGGSTPVPMRLVQQLLKSALTARAGPQSTALGATVPGASPCNTVMARPGRTHRSRAPAVSTGLVAGAHMRGWAYLDGCGVALVAEPEAPRR